MVNRALDIVLLGPPGAGKGTQGRRLADAFGLLHLSVGELLRDEVSHASEVGEEARSYLASGELAPDGLVRRMLLRSLHSQPGSAGCVFDGYPRNAHQTQLLDGLLAELGRRVDAALYLAVPDDVALVRMAAQLACRDCGRPYAGNGTAPAACTACNGALELRAEEEGVALERLRVWRAHTVAVLDFYRGRGILREIDGVGEVGSVFGELRSAMESVLRR